MIFEINNINWKSYHGALIPSVSPHIEIELSKKEQEELLKRSKAYFLRWTSDWDCQVETKFWYVIKDKFKGFEELSRNTRNQVRKGLKNCIIKKVDAQFIADNAYPVYKSAYERYDTYEAPVKEELFYTSTVQLQTEKEREFWAAFNKKNDELIAYAQTIVKEAACHYYLVKLHPKYLKLYPSYALFFEMNKHYLDDLKLKYVNDGARSISHQTNIQNFLIQKFKFRKAYCKLNIAYVPKVKLLVNVFYPFKNIILKFNNSITNKIEVLLQHEEIRRSYK